MSAPDDDPSELEAGGLDAADANDAADAHDAPAAHEAADAYDAADAHEPQALGSDDAADGLRDEGLDLDALARAQGEGPLLSAEESAALFDAIRTGAVEAHATRPATLGSADEPMRRAQSRIDELAPLAASDLRDALLRTGTVPESVDASPCEVHPLETFTKNVPPSAAVWTVRSQGEAVARVVLEPNLVGALLERRLGAADALLGGRPIERAPSALELRVLEPIARAACERIVAPFVPGTLVFGPPGRANELGSPLVPCATVTLLLTPRRGEPAQIQIALFASSLGHVSGTTKVGARLGDVLPGVEVEIAAVLGCATSTVRALLMLERGSVLRLDGAPDRPIELRVDGVAVLRGVPVVKDGNLAIEVSP